MDPTLSWALRIHEAEALINARQGEHSKVLLKEQALHDELAHAERAKVGIWVHSCVCELQARRHCLLRWPPAPALRRQQAPSRPVHVWGGMRDEHSGGPREQGWPPHPGGHMEP